MRTVAYRATVHYHHTDCGGVVYYARYLEFLEEARTQCFAQAGLAVADLMRQDCWFAVARQESEHLAPARYGDLLTVETGIQKLSRMKVVFACRVTRQDGATVLTARTVMACVGSDFAPRAIPETVRTALQAFCGEAA